MGELDSIHLSLTFDFFRFYELLLAASELLLESIALDVELINLL